MGSASGPPPHASEVATHVKRMTLPASKKLSWITEVKKILGELEVDVKEETQSYANPFEVAALASTSADKGEAPSSGNGEGKAKAEDSPRDAPWPAIVQHTLVHAGKDGHSECGDGSGGHARYPCGA